MQKIAKLRKPQKKIMKATGIEHRRNGALFDTWSKVHLVTGILLGWIMDPFVAVVVMVLWEPFEILILSPFLKKYFGIIFGFETLRNSLSDVVFDILGVVTGFYILNQIIDPPIFLF